VSDRLPVEPVVGGRERGHIEMMGDGTDGGDGGGEMAPGRQKR
jgi:hypothetical protein